MIWFLFRRHTRRPQIRSSCPKRRYQCSLSVKPWLWNKNFYLSPIMQDLWNKSISEIRSVGSYWKSSSKIIKMTKLWAGTFEVARIRNFTAFATFMVSQASYSSSFDSLISQLSWLRNHAWLHNLFQTSQLSSYDVKF